MTGEQLPIAPMSPESRHPAAAVAAEGAAAVINLREIKSILYLGVRGKVPLPASESHRVDTYA